MQLFDPGQYRMVAAKVVVPYGSDRRLQQVLGAAMAVAAISTFRDGVGISTVQLVVEIFDRLIGVFG